ncbi:hypothetical protein F5B18DRAFT_615372 [Nemania serpens]|nr:hypothetical protein F5B18DRAFT_615372 [Nemania serpens]
MFTSLILVYCAQFVGCCLLRAKLSLRRNSSFHAVRIENWLFLLIFRDLLTEAFKRASRWNHKRRSPISLDDVLSMAT